MTDGQALIQVEYNSPQKQDNEKHIGLLVGSIYLAVSLILSSYVDSSLAMFIIFGQGYLVYFAIVKWFDSTWNYLAELQPIEAYDSIHDKLKDDKGYFQFTTSCYHYESSTSYKNKTDSEGRVSVESSTTTNKIVTHSKTEVLNVRECVDISGKIASLDEGQAVVFMQYIVKLQHNGDQSQQALKDKFAQFKEENRRDDYQQASFKFVLPSLKEGVGYELKHLPEMHKYKTWALLGLAYLLALKIEKSVARYQVTLTKKVTV